jgi:hypothetical protein
VRFVVTLLLVSCASAERDPSFSVVETTAATVDASATMDASAAQTLPAAPANVVVRERSGGARRGGCVYDDPTDGGCGIGASCAASIEREVACPPATEWLVIDIQEGLRGPVVVVVDGVNVFSDSVQPVSIVGLVKSIHVRPKRWPAEVDVRGMRATTHVSVPRATRFMAVHGPALTTGLSATPFMYE